MSDCLKVRISVGDGYGGRGVGVQRGDLLDPDDNRGGYSHGKHTVTGVVDVLS